MCWRKGELCLCVGKEEYDSGMGGTHIRCVGKEGVMTRTGKEGVMYGRCWEG